MHIRRGTAFASAPLIRSLLITMLSAVLVVGAGAVTASASTTGAIQAGTVAAAPSRVEPAPSAVTYWSAQGYYATKSACVNVGLWYVNVRLAHAYACKRVGHPVGPLRDPYQLWLLLDWACGGVAPRIAVQACG